MQKAQVDRLEAIYNDQNVLKKFSKTIEEYALNQRSMDQIKDDCKEIELKVKTEFKITPAIFKKIVKQSLVQDDKTDNLLEGLRLINDIALASKK